MKTKTRRPTSPIDQPLAEELGHSFDLETLSDDELEHLLFQDDPQKQEGFWNLPTVAGLSLIVVGVAYIFQEMGIWNGFDVTVLASMLPWIAGVLIILLGFGVLSWRPARKRKPAKTAPPPSGREEAIAEEKPSKPRRKRRLMRSRDKKIAGVAAGVAEYFGLDPTLVRIAFVIGTIASGGPFLLAYLALMFVLPKPDALTFEERITIIRDS